MAVLNLFLLKPHLSSGCVPPSHVAAESWRFLLCSLLMRLPATGIFTSRKHWEIQRVHAVTLNAHLEIVFSKHCPFTALRPQRWIVAHQFKLLCCL